MELQNQNFLVIDSIYSASAYVHRRSLAEARLCRINFLRGYAAENWSA